MPKRHGHLFERIVDPSNLHDAYLKARKGKSRLSGVQRFEKDIPGNLEKIRQSLLDRTFTTSAYQEKQIREPKPRTIYVLPFCPDRIVQHALVSVVEPIWDKLMLSDSYACRKNKGLHAGSTRTMEFVRRYRYCLKCDVARFYPSVDQQILEAIVARKIKCPQTLWLIRDIIYSYPGGKNVPIGNYTSQWFGNLYLNELDHFVKDGLRIKGYVRYCDDFCLFHDDKAVLRAAAVKIERFLQDRLLLRFSKCDLFPVSRGVDFLGYRHFPKYLLLRKSTAKRVKRRLRALARRLANGKVAVEKARSSLASTKGWLKWANTHHLAETLRLDALLHEAVC